MTRYGFVSVVLLLVVSFLPPLAHSAALPNGQHLSDSISVSGQVDQHTFTGTAGDTIYLRAADTSNSALTPELTLVDPDGIVLRVNSGNLVAHIDGRRLVKSGTYTVFVADGSTGGNATGPYNIYYAKAPGANDDGVLPNGEMLSGTIDLGDFDTYTFNALAGETVFIRVADTETTQFVNSNFTPNVTLIDPDGEVLGANAGNLVAHIDKLALVKSGTYTVMVYDASTGDDNNGTYDIYYAKGPGANDDGELPNGGMLADVIDLGDIDTYSFSAFAGETIYIRVADTETTQFINSRFTPAITLLDPDGAAVRTNAGNLVAHIDRLTLSKSGTYTVVVYDASTGDDNAGTYDIYYAKAAGASDNGCLANNQVASDFIDLGDIDSYSFNANAGMSVKVTIKDLGASSFVPSVTLLGPTGNYIATASDNDTAQINKTLAESGVFTLIVIDASTGDDHTGNYQIDMNGVGVTCPLGLCNGMPVTVFIGAGDTPTSGADVILGTSGADTIVAMGGNDTICGLGGNDNINGGRGNDWIDAGAGNDNVNGANDNDVIYGDIGIDTLFGGPGNDEIYGEDGDDFIKGNSGDDMLFGNGGIDKISGGSGNDTIYTGLGSNVGTLQTVTGGNGDDTMFGGSDADEIRGEAGNDTITGGVGNDRLYGGAGEDNINGQAGNDLVRGNAADDVLRGGAGNDQVDGLGGNDVMYGGAGEDTLNGSTGEDTMYGESGDDFLHGGGGNDVLNGGGGTDDCNGAGGIGDSAIACETESNIP